MIIGSKTQRFMWRLRQNQLVLIVMRQRLPTHITPFGRIDDQPERLAPVATVTACKWFDRLTSFRINRDCLNAERRTDFDLHRIGRRSDEHSRHRELNEQPRHRGEQQYESM